jgi:glycerol-3-phosphate acyltransferase PlsY
VLELGIKLLLGYVLGSVNGSLLVGRLRGGVDIRRTGSGNPGATNALRTQGLGFAFWTMLIDVGKGYLPTALLPAIALPGVGLDPAVDRAWLAAACAAAAVIGHCYPFWYRFSGGKGAATMAGVILALTPIIVLPTVAVWLAMLVLSGLVGLATMAAGFVPAIVLAIQGQASLDYPPFVLYVCGALFMIFTHRQNIRRMRAGTEQPISRLGVFRRG